MSRVGPHNAGEYFLGCLSTTSLRRATLVYLWKVNSRPRFFNIPLCFSRFYIVTDTEVAAHLKATEFPSLVFTSEGDEADVTFDKEWDATTVSEWCIGSSVPLVIEFTDQVSLCLVHFPSGAWFLNTSRAMMILSYIRSFHQSASVVVGTVTS
jgi:hypothetical protein